MGTHYPLESHELVGVEHVALDWAQHSRADPRLWQRPLLDVPGWQGRAVPLCIHGDGAEFQQRDSLTIVSIKALLGSNTHDLQHLLFTAVPKSITASKRHHAEDTWEVL